MFDQAPFTTIEGTGPAPANGDRLGVVVPTRNRPERLERCLDALDRARNGVEFRVFVCDSSEPPHDGRVAELCRRYPFVDLIRHDRIGATAARNVGTKACAAELVVSVDDDVYVAPDTIAELVRAYDGGRGLRVVAGAVDWGFWESRPLVMRPIGYAREARAGERVEFLVSALLLYPRALGLALPWNERLWPYDDRFASLLWRAAGADLLFAPNAKAKHDPIHSDYPVDREADRIYANLFDAIFVTRSLRRLVAFELLGFAACAKKWARTPRGALGLIFAWIRGQVAFARDYGRLREAVQVARGFSARPRRPN
jgi:glycosyltransferase involved in cell wall biosynthesis